MKNFKKSLSSSAFKNSLTKVSQEGLSNRETYLALLDLEKNAQVILEEILKTTFWSFDLNAILRKWQDQNTEDDFRAILRELVEGEAFCYIFEVLNQNKNFENFL